MSLHRGSFDIAKQIFTLTIGATPETKAAFAALAPKEQVNAVLESFETNDTFLTTDFGLIEAACFVLLFRTQSGLATPAEAKVLRGILGIPAPKGWQKPMPYVNYMALVSQWPEEFSKVPEIAATLSHASLAGDLAIADTFVAAGVRAVLGLGGLEDNADEGVGPSDPIMKLFIDAVKFQLMTVTRPQWFSNGMLLKTLPADVDGRSLYEANKNVEAEKLKIRAEARRQAAAVRRQQLVDAYATKKADFFAGPVHEHKGIAEVITALKLASFEDLKALTKADVWLTDDLKAIAKTFCVAAPAALAADATDAAKAAHATATEAAIDADQAVVFVQQFILAELAQAKPDWFTKRSNSDLALRFGIGKVGTIDRPTRVIRFNISKLIRKYSLAAVQAQCKLFIDAPDTVIVAKDEPEEIELEAEAKAAAK